MLCVCVCVARKIFSFHSIFHVHFSVQFFLLSINVCVFFFCCGCTLCVTTENYNICFFGCVLLFATDCYVFFFRSYDGDSFVSFSRFGRDQPIGICVECWWLASWILNSENSFFFSFICSFVAFFALFFVFLVCLPMFRIIFQWFFFWAPTNHTIHILSCFLHCGALHYMYCCCWLFFLFVVCLLFTRSIYVNIQIEWNYRKRHEATISRSFFLFSFYFNLFLVKYIPVALQPMLHDSIPSKCIQQRIHNTKWKRTKWI